jgi:hypothetical protein
MFLLRTAFWTSVALALIPSFAPTQSQTVPIDLPASEAVTAASATVADVSTFCERRPQACAAGAEFISAFGQRAEAGAKILYELVSERLAKPDADKASRHTLTATDMAPAWRGPVRRDGQGKRPT